MWTGRVFRLRKPILGIEAVKLVEGEPRAHYIPEKEVVRVVSGPSVTAVEVVEVEWQQRHFSVFVWDLEDAVEIRDLRTPTSPPAKQAHESR